MLKIRDKDNKLKYVLFDDAEEPVSIDELVIREYKKKVKVKKDKPEDNKE